MGETSYVRRGEAHINNTVKNVVVSAYRTLTLLANGSQVAQDLYLRGVEAPLVLVVGVLVE